MNYLYSLHWYEIHAYVWDSSFGKLEWWKWSELTQQSKSALDHDYKYRIWIVFNDDCTWSIVLYDNVRLFMSLHIIYYFICVCDKLI